MNKRGEEGGDVVGWIFFGFFVITIIGGFVSPNLCDKLLIAVGIFGLICLFFGRSMLITMHTAGFVFFLFLTFVSIVIWITLTATGACVNLPNILNSLHL